MVYFNILKKQGLRQIPICSETMKQIVQIRSKKAISVEISPPLIKQLLKHMTSGKEIKEEFPGGHAKIMLFLWSLKSEFPMWKKRVFLF